MLNYSIALYGMVWYTSINIARLSQMSLMCYVRQYPENSQVFTPCLKEPKCCCVRRLSGKEFQTIGPCTANARRPTVESRCYGTTISYVHHHYMLILNIHITDITSFWSQIIWPRWTLTTKHAQQQYDSTHIMPFLATEQNRQHSDASTVCVCVCEHVR